MSSYCLLRSSGQGPEGWEPLVQQLERRGHRALTPAFHVSRTALKTGRSVRSGSARLLASGSE